MSNDRTKTAYDTFRGGFERGHPNTPPHWDDLPDWVGDALRVSYFQGKLDGKSETAQLRRILTHMRKNSGECLGDNPRWMAEIDKLLASTD